MKSAVKRMELFTNTHRRFNPLTKEWVLVCSKRTNRPWQGAEEDVLKEQGLSHEPDCYLCPGNTRANGEVNPVYSDTFVFENDFAALKPKDDRQKSGNDLFQAEEVSGTCRVICFSAQHNLTLPDMSEQAIKQVVDVWQQQFVELSEQYAWVQIFENKGSIMGCSNPHPHGQIWASQFLPNELAKEHASQQAYYSDNNKSLLLDYVHKELELAERIVDENEDWVVLVPYWAVWPFETLLLPKNHIPNWQSVTESQKHTLASIMKCFLQRYDRLFNVSFPYSMGWHCAPNIENANNFWQLHAHFYPPLLRSATVKKFMVGYEMLAEAQRDITPEDSVKLLREA